MRLLLYLAKPKRGGWVSTTVHLSLGLGLKIVKISKKTQNKNKPFAFGKVCQNVAFKDLKSHLDSCLITALDKNYYNYLRFFPKNTPLILWDPTELKREFLPYLDYFQIITCREMVYNLLKNGYNIRPKLFKFPFYKFKKNVAEKKDKVVSISRVDFDKHTEILLEANQYLDTPIEIYGAKNDIYVYHKLDKNLFEKYYKGEFGNSFQDLNNILGDAKFMVDMSAIKQDGGGMQYTFLEALHLEAVPILSNKWTDVDKTIWKDNKNCFIAKDGLELVSVIKRGFSLDLTDILNENKKMLDDYTGFEQWNKIF